MFFEDLVRALDDGHVRYALVGGVAVNLHGVPRMTYDVDIVVQASIDDLVRMKRQAGRPQDLADILHLERLKREP